MEALLTSRVAELAVGELSGTLTACPASTFLGSDSGVPELLALAAALAAWRLA
jgi:hypothetical protein